MDIFTPNGNSRIHVGLQKSRGEKTFQIMVAMGSDNERFGIAGMGPGSENWLVKQPVSEEEITNEITAQYHVLPMSFRDLSLAQAVADPATRARVERGLGWLPDSDEILRIDLPFADGQKCHIEFPIGEYPEILFSFSENVLYSDQALAVDDQLFWLFDDLYDVLDRELSALHELDETSVAQAHSSIEYLEEPNSMRALSYVVPEHFSADADGLAGCLYQGPSPDQLELLNVRWRNLKSEIMRTSLGRTEPGLPAIIPNLVAKEPDFGI